MTPYNVVLLDPPWRYDNKQNGAADAHYATLSVRELADLPCFRDGSIADDALVACWVTTPFLHHLWRSDASGFRGDGLLDAWRARFVTSLYWHKAPAPTDFYDAGRQSRPVPKTPLGTGYWFRGETEQLVIAIRGKFPALRSPIRNHYTHPPLAHSEKPEIFRQAIVSALAYAAKQGRLDDHPPRYLELFARRAVPGWRCEGLELTGHDHRLPLGAYKIRRRRR